MAQYRTTRHLPPNQASIVHIESLTADVPPANESALIWLAENA